MSSRTPHDVRSPADSIWLETLKFSVTGSGVGDMTGSLIEGTNLNAVITFPSGSVPGITTNAPSGSFLITLPGGGSPGGPPNGRYPRVMSWHASFEAVGTDPTMDARATANAFEVRQYGHSSVSGTFLGGFVRPSGSITNGGNIVYKGTVPEDRVNPGSNVGSVNVTFVFRNTPRRV